MTSVFCATKIFTFLIVLLFFCKRCMFIFVCSVFVNWVCWVRGNFSGEPGHVFRVCVSAVWSAGPVQVYLGTLVVWTAGLYGFSFLSGSAVAGTVRLKW